MVILSKGFVKRKIIDASLVLFQGRFSFYFLIDLFLFEVLFGEQLYIIEEVVCSNFGSLSPLFLLSSSFDKVQTRKLPFIIEDSLRPLAFSLIFTLDRPFFFPYTLSLKKQLLSKLVS
jgi:hypothetical protein